MHVLTQAPLSELSILQCHELWCRSQMQLEPCVALSVVQASSCSSSSTPSPRISICCRCSLKRQNTYICVCAHTHIHIYISPYLWSSRLSLVLSSKSFIVLCFTFRSVICLELIFVKGVWCVYNFFFFAWLVYYSTIVENVLCLLCEIIMSLMLLDIPQIQPNLKL